MFMMPMPPTSSAMEAMPALGDDVGQPHAGGSEVVFGGLHHQGEGRLGNAVLHGNLPGDGHEVAVAILIPADGGDHLDIVQRRDGSGLGGQGRFLVDHGGLCLAAAPQRQHHHQRRAGHDQQPFEVDAAGQPHFRQVDVLEEIREFHMGRLLVRWWAGEGYVPERADMHGGDNGIHTDHVPCKRPPPRCISGAYPL